MHTVLKVPFFLALYTYIPQGLHGFTSHPSLCFFFLIFKSSVNFLYIRYKMSNWNELFVTTPIKQIHRQVGLNLKFLKYPTCMITTRPLKITTVSCVLVPCIRQYWQSYGVYALANDLLLNTRVQLFNYLVISLK